MVETKTRPLGGRGARERIERASAQLFYRHGIHATGVELIAQEANVSKRTLYQHFPSKNDLVDSYLRGVDARGGSPLERRLDDTTLSARDRLLAIFEMSRREVMRGCPFHNAAVESAGSLPSTDEIVRAHKQHFTGCLDRCRAGSRRRRSSPAGPAAGRVVRRRGRDGDVAQRHRAGRACPCGRGHSDRRLAELLTTSSRGC